MSIIFLDVIENIKKFKNLHTDIEVANALKMTKGNFSNHKTSKSVPYERIIIFCEQENINPAKILYGTDKIPKSEIFTKKYDLENITGGKMLSDSSKPHESYTPADSDDPQWSVKKLYDRLEKDIDDCKETETSMWGVINQLRTEMENMRAVLREVEKSGDLKPLKQLCGDGK